MIVTLLSCKGGVGKTTSAIHIAAYLNTFEPTLLVDGDQNRSCLDWSERGTLPFKVCDERAGVKLGRDYKHIVIDTAARPSPQELKDFASGCDLLIIPTTPDALSLGPTLEMAADMRKLKAPYKILLTRVHPKPSNAGDEARRMLMAAELPIFKTSIRSFRAFEHAALEGVPVYETKDRNRNIAWKCYKDLGAEIL